MSYISWSLVTTNNDKSLSTSSISVAKVRKPPYISKTNSERKAREHKLYLVVPLATVYGGATVGHHLFAIRLVYSNSNAFGIRHQLR